ncbi:uncharacterized protein K444DRAFT_258469 [Hyaloscypha bicolor E]|uniref:Uncharacterized protein n=1 Tax=Hyaloscypha bicolor E TaxID=1095630 RepID=A0A2J6SNI7_9HELO|nr:uncharacterized protein K444DRAFT_258469 [Hyaloscypha bicolor E]PMD52313.1 hypothetical protein K444DRAFT_258469 [Hyaloscypha bicolor E]
MAEEDVVEEITSFGRSRGKPWMDRCWIRNRKEVKHKLGKDNPIRRPAQVHSLDTPRNPDTRTRSRNLRKQRKQELSKTCVLKEIRRRWTVTFRVVLAVPCISLGLKYSLFLSRPLLPLGSKLFPLLLECRIFSPDIVDDPQLALFVRDKIQKSCVDFFFFLNLC